MDMSAYTNCSPHFRVHGIGAKQPDHRASTRMTMFGKEVQDAA